MFTYIIRRLRRRPIIPLAVLGLSLILSFALCLMQHNYEEEERAYHETYTSIPIYVVVTDLSGMYSDDLSIPGFYADVFSGQSLIEPRLSSYLKDVRAKMSCPLAGQYGLFSLQGINHIDLAPELTEDGSVDWAEGYDEGVFTGDEMVCIVPEGLALEMGSSIELTVQSSTIYFRDGEQYRQEYTFSLSIVGQHSGDSRSIYVPYLVVNDAAKRVDNRELSHLSATLADNYALEEFRAMVPGWFAEPDPMGNRSDWSYGSYTYYPNALDINDELLKRAEDTLSASLLINQMASVLVFILSAGAGFFLGFLIIRGSKREISLMRTLGQSGGKIFMGFAAEQLVCVILGTVIGGAAFLWQPTERLCIFVGMYFAGLCAALLVFLNKNLLQGQKEDE